MKKDQNVVFLNPENKNLFKPEQVVGKKIKISVYKKLFKDKNLLKILENEAINETIDAFIKGGLNLSHASASSYVHRNTLIYRIEKVNRIIGLDLRNFEDCLIFVNMREIYRMVVKKQWCLKIQLNC